MSYTNVESLAKTAKELMLKEPFYGLLLMSLNKVWDKNCQVGGQGTAGVSLKGINYELRIHPDFWEGLDPLKKMGILKHELLHIGFFHLTDYGSYADKEVLNMAMDVEINQYIDKDWLPEWGCFLEKFPELKMEEKMGTRYYYEKMMEAKDKGKAVMKAISDSLCNGGQGGDTPEDGEGNRTVTLPDGQEMKIPKHDWEEIEKMDEAKKKLIESQTKHIVTQVADQVQKSRGTIPGEFAELIERLLTHDPPKFDWKGYIRRFAGKSTKTYTKSSRRKANKRLPENPGLKIKRQKHILFAIDTSGSVSNKELKECMAELYHIQKTGSEVTIIQCDTAISHIGKFDHKKDTKIHGRGGTDFQPVIDYYNEQSHQYSCLMYFTDGEAPAPDNARGKILWILSEQSHKTDHLPGQTIQLEL